MITGVVNPDREAVIRLKIYGVGGQVLEIDVVIDTGFTGSLTLPPHLVATLQLPFYNRQQVILGDGNIHSLDVHTGTIDWEGQPRRIEINVADTTPLAGMNLMYGYKLTIEDVDGGAVLIEVL